MSAGGTSRAGAWSGALAALVVTGGAVHTTAPTTAAGLTTATAKTSAKKIRKIRVLRAPPCGPEPRSLVRKIFKLRRQLANPAPVVEPADESGVALVAGDVEELLLRDERAQARKVGVGAVAHDAADHPRELAPLAFGERLPVAGDGHQQRGGGAGDGVGEDLLALRALDDLAARADDVGDTIATHADDVAAASDRGPFEISRPCVHCQAHYSK